MSEGGELRSPMSEEGELRSPMSEGGEPLLLLLVLASFNPVMHFQIKYIKKNYLHSSKSGFQVFKNDNRMLVNVYLLLKSRAPK
jgi:hypothetical protein